ncbi:MAG: hypothetical protein LBQ36_05940 [Synergistaceae bacterium]|nr:hypothetical protein [Synergistaceae bacterium]
MSANELSGEIRSALALLGLARRAGALVVGQDQVFRALKSGGGLFIVASEDCAHNVIRKTENPKCELRLVGGLSRTDLGGAIGVGSAQIAALPLGSGFAKKLKELLKISGGAINE